jgi:hypothetical protein
VNLNLHYFRAGHPMSPRTRAAFDSANKFLLGSACLTCLTAVSAFAQYPGVIAKKSNTAQLRAVAVLEWTGDAGKPKACRIVPVTIFDGEKLNDAGIYLARPEPLAIAGEVEYQLKDDGKTIGLFDIKNTGQEQGSWVGYGEWKPVPSPQPVFAAKAPDLADDESDEKPVLHRKKHADDSSHSGSGTSDSGADKPPEAPEDPDRPKLHKKDDSSSTSTSSDSGSDSGAPTLHKGSDTKSDTQADSSSSGAPDDPDRPKLKKQKQKPAEDVSRSEALPQVTDPDRPRLQRGKSNADNLRVLPSLMGLPPDMQQAVAVSDAQNHPDHPWAYSWANKGDEDKMKEQLEDMARTMLGLNQHSPAPKPVPHRAGAAVKKAALPAAPPPPPAELQDEQFRVFELTYGSGATLVLTADTGGPLAKEKFITLVAQPDIYGNLQVVLKNVTDGTHLDETPLMRIVDAVDALADNRGELLFELRGETSRQFALFRIMRGRADKMFVSGGGYYGTMSSQ